MYLHYFPDRRKCFVSCMGDIKVERVKNRKYITWEKMYRIYQTRCFAFRFLYFHSTWTDRCKNNSPSCHTYAYYSTVSNDSASGGKTMPV